MCNVATTKSCGALRFGTPTGLLLWAKMKLFGCGTRIASCAKWTPPKLRFGTCVRFLWREIWPRLQCAAREGSCSAMKSPKRTTFACSQSTGHSVSTLVGSFSIICICCARCREGRFRLCTSFQPLRFNLLLFFLPFELHLNDLDCHIVLLVNGFQKSIWY
jgi:hypothetical protein